MSFSLAGVSVEYAVQSVETAFSVELVLDATDGFELDTVEEEVLFGGIWRSSTGLDEIHSNIFSTHFRSPSQFESPQLDRNDSFVENTDHVRVQKNCGDRLQATNRPSANTIHYWLSWDTCRQTSAFRD